LARIFSVVHVECHVTTRSFSDGESIAHEAEPILGVVFNVKVLGAEIFQHFAIVEDAAGIQRRDLALDLAVLVPGSTPRRPDGPFEELLRVDIVITDSLLLDANTPTAQQYRVVSLFSPKRSIGGWLAELT
jgi:hypothetical protein